MWLCRGNDVRKQICLNQSLVPGLNRCEYCKVSQYCKVSRAAQTAWCLKSITLSKCMKLPDGIMHPNHSKIMSMCTHAQSTCWTWIEVVVRSALLHVLKSLVLDMVLYSGPSRVVPCMLSCSFIPSPSQICTNLLRVDLQSIHLPLLGLGC
jgi:hypothetical protein